MRIAELGTMYRYERVRRRSAGLSRVRAMTLNDAHQFLDPARSTTRSPWSSAMIKDAYAALGMSGHQLPPVDARGRATKYVARRRPVGPSRAALAGALDDLGRAATSRSAGEAAFYGPKIDVQVRAAAAARRRSRRSSSTSTCRSSSTWRTPARTGPRRPVMIHRVRALQRWSGACRS